MDGSSGLSGASPSISMLDLQKKMQERPFDQAQFMAQFEAAAKSAGVDSSKLGDLERQVQEAVQNTLKAGGSGDKRAAIRDAVDSVLKNNGIDPGRFRSALETQRTHKKDHPPVLREGKRDETPTFSQSNGRGGLDLSV